MYWLYLAAESSLIIAAHVSSPTSTVVLNSMTRDPQTVTNIHITPLWLLGCILLHMGSSIRLACYRALGKHFTWELAVTKDQKLVTTGPYAVVRHPSYVGSLLNGIGMVLLHFAPGSWFAECVGWRTWPVSLMAAAWATWCLSVPAMLMARVKNEDRVLKAEFGPEWERYATATPYRLLPGIY